MFSILIPQIQIQSLLLIFKDFESSDWLNNSHWHHHGGAIEQLPLLYEHIMEVHLEELFKHV